jgi:hypothetical protein
VVEALERAVLVGDDRQTVDSHEELRELDAVGFALRGFVLVHGARSVGAVPLAGLGRAEQLVPVARAGTLHLDLHVGVLLGEELGHQTGDRLHGRGSGDLDLSAVLCTRRYGPEADDCEGRSSQHRDDRAAVSDYADQWTPPGLVEPSSGTVWKRDGWRLTAR